MGHRTPTYIVNRLRRTLRERRHPADPWWTPGAIALVDRWLGKHDTVVEFGSGRSTAWLASRAGRVVSVEHHEGWCDKVRGQLAQGGHGNAEVRLAPDEPAGYVRAADDVARPTFVVVDGRHRDACMVWAIDRLAPGGTILLDDSQRYLPHAGRFTLRSVPDTPQPTALWNELLPRINNWRRLTYSDGVNDTTLLVHVPGS